MKKVSILIPAYKPRFFRTALTSAIAQTWENREIIVSDDCPDSSIREICRDFENLITYIRNPNPGNGGRNNTLNLFMHASGDYLKFLFDDDVLDPFCVKLLVDSLDAHGSCAPALAFSPRIIIDENDRFLEKIDHFKEDCPSIISSEALVRFMATKLINPIGEMTTVLFEREALKERLSDLSLGMINGRILLGLGDVALFVQILEKGPAAFVPQPLSYFRKHNQSNSNPEINENWPLLMTDWRLVIDYAHNNRVLENAETYVAYTHLIQHLHSWKAEYPVHATKFEEEIASIEAILGAFSPVSRRTGLLSRLLGGLRR